MLRLLWQRPVRKSQGCPGKDEAHEPPDDGDREKVASDDGRPEPEEGRRRAVGILKSAIAPQKKRGDEGAPRERGAGL